MATKTYICNHSGNTQLPVGKKENGAIVYKTLKYKKNVPFEADEKHVKHLGEDVQETTKKEVEAVEKAEAAKAGKKAKS